MSGLFASLVSQGCFEDKLFFDPKKEPALQDAMLDEPTTLRLLIPGPAVGSVIGKGGARVQGLRDGSTTKVKVSQVDDNVFGAPERLVTVEGTLGSCCLAQQAIMLMTAKDQDAEEFTFKFIFDVDYTARIIGKGGEVIKGITATSGASIGLTDDRDLPPGFPDRPVTVTGSFKSVSLAVCLLLDKIAQMHTGVVPNGFALKVATGEVGSIIGKGGDRIKAIRDSCDCKVQIAEEEPQTRGFRRVTITGEPDNVKKAVAAIAEHLGREPEEWRDPIAPRPSRGGPPRGGRGPSFDRGPPPRDMGRRDMARDMGPRRGDYRDMGRDMGRGMDGPRRSMDRGWGGDRSRVPPPVERFDGDRYDRFSGAGGREWDRHRGGERDYDRRGGWEGAVDRRGPPPAASQYGTDRDTQAYPPARVDDRYGASDRYAGGRDSYTAPAPTYDYSSTYGANASSYPTTAPPAATAYDAAPTASSYGSRVASAYAAPEATGGYDYGVASSAYSGSYGKAYEGAGTNAAAYSAYAAPADYGAPPAATATPSYTTQPYSGGYDNRSTSGAVHGAQSGAVRDRYAPY